MQDKELYYQLLGLSEPWRVNVVEVDFKELYSGCICGMAR